MKESILLKKSTEVKNNNQIQKIENYTVWNILPIPGTQEILTKDNFGTLKMSDLFNKPINKLSNLI